MDVLEMNKNNNSRIFSIIFSRHSLLVFQLQCLMVHKAHLLIVGDTSILVTKFIEVIFNFNFCRRLFILTIGLIHFGNNFYFLLNYSNSFFAIQAPGLCADILDKSVLTGFAFLWVLRSDVDCVHNF